jgi:hypothetical protein
MFKDARNMRLTPALREKDEIARRFRDAERQLETVPGQFVETDNASLIKFQETKIARPERKKDAALA